MTPREQAFLSRLRATFRVEAAEHLQTMAVELLALEKVPAAERKPTQCEAIFRTAHSLKGASRAVSAPEIEVVCQALEGIFSGWKHGTLTPAAESFDVLHQSVNLLAQLVQSLGEPQSVATTATVADTVAKLQAIATGLGQGQGAREPEAPRPVPQSVPGVAPAAAGPNPASTSPSRDLVADAGGLRSAETIRVPVGKLDRLLQNAEEMLTLKQAATQRAGELKELRAGVMEWQQQWGRIQRTTRTLQQAVQAPAARTEREGEGPLGAVKELLEFLEWSAAHLRGLDSLIVTAYRGARRDGHAAGKMVDAVMAGTKHLLMLPISTVMDSLPLLARQLGREQGKDINMEIRGGEVEMDKRILEEMKDPLIHLVRNAVDHGVESAAERTRRGKPSAATLTITVANLDGSKVDIAIADDGAGIDPAKVKNAAVGRGVISAEAAGQLDAQQATALIFLSDVTTSPIVTDISGRGLGLAIVREKAEKLGGRVSVETRLGGGTVFRLLLPITLAAFRGLLIRVQQHIFVLPATAVERVALIRTTEIGTVENRETTALHGKAVSLSRLAAVLEIVEASSTLPSPAAVPVVILGTQEQRVAFVVDEVLHDEEVLVKPLAQPLQRVRNVAGATVLASGLLVPVLSPSDLLKSARKAVVASARTHREGGATAAALKSILVAEDSITSRTLLKGILESAGYRVKTTVDGVEALEALRSGNFDLVVSDVQMPRMNGFDLTARIRAERRTAEIPVVLVTALSSPEDRERGIDVGANAYLVKSDFEQSNLLEIIHRLA